MKFVESIVLLPCHSLEDFPVYPTGDEAQGLLAAWSAIWHPALVACTEQLPQWRRADDPQESLVGRLLVVPGSSESLLPAGWASRARSEGAVVLRKYVKRSELVAAALAELDAEWHAQVDPDLAGDFFALGTAYLLIELLTRQMRYMSNLDEIQLRNETVAAAQAAIQGQTETARQCLQHAFEVLAEARERFYPVHSYLIDLTLVAPTTMGQPLRDELLSDAPGNLLLPASVLETLATAEADTLAALRAAIDHGRFDVAGGDRAERELPLLPIESVRGNLLAGVQSYERALGKRPTVYGRRRFGLSPVLPQVLSRMGFDGALHFTLDDGQFPPGEQAKTRWEGLDSSALDAVCRVPLDASLPETFLQLPQKLGNAMDLDHVATLVLAHWPGQGCDYYHDLRRAARYGTALGKFVTLGDYFLHTDRPGELTRFRADQYRAPYLRQAIVRQQADAISRLAWHHELDARARAVDTLAMFAGLLGDSPIAEPWGERVEQWSLAGDARALAAGEPALADAQAAATRRLAGIVARAAQAPSEGVFVANGQSFARRAIVDVSSLVALPSVAGPVIAVQQSAGQKWALVDVPGNGFAWVASGPTAAKPVRPAAPLANGTQLQNEHMQVNVHAETGGLRSIYDGVTRGNRLSLQLAMRLPTPKPKPGDLWSDPDENAAYSLMAADQVEVTLAGPALSEITSRGRLVSLEGKQLATFVLRYRLAAGSRVLHVAAELDVAEPPRADPWNSYYAMRFAWGDAGADLWRSVAGTAQPTSAKRLEAPQFIDIRGDKTRTTLLTGGLPYHRSTGERMLDTLLVVRGESQRRFRLGVGIDAPHPAQEALDLFDAPQAVAGVPLPEPTSGSRWLFHVDARNVVATHWEARHDAGTLGGVRLRLLETEGRPGRVWLRCFRPPRAARQLDFLGQTLVELNLDGDRVPIDFAAYEWNEIEVSF